MPSASDDDTSLWVLVVGMHRSGTSAVAGALAHMGLALPPQHEVPTTGRSDRPALYESISLTAFNERLLSRRGGSWSAPPASEVSAQPPGVLTEEAQQARELVSTVYSTSGPSVWKDPRLCLLLPFWRTTLGRIGGVLYIWRNPLEVAQSLVARNGFTMSHGLALWEWYNHQALLGMVGLPVLATSYDSIVERGPAFEQQVAGWLVDRVRVGATASIAGVVKPSLRHHHHTEVRGRLLPEQDDLVNVLDTLHGPYDRFELPAIPEVSPWTTDLLTARRDFEQVHPTDTPTRKSILEPVHVVFRRLLSR